MKRLLCACLALCLCLCAASGMARALSTADAVEPVSLTKDASLTLTYRCDGVALSGAPVSLYRIADFSADAQFTLTDVFQSTGLTLNGISSNREWDIIRTTLEGRIAADRLSPYRTASTDGEGCVRFEGLTPALYLVLPVQGIQDDAQYSFDSALITVPGLEQDGRWSYDVSVLPKAVRNEPTGTELEYTVLKLWQDAGSEDRRPTSVAVDLICNGSVVETVVLCGENNWSYTWTATDNGDVWQAVERNVPEGYVMTVERHTAGFTIVNTIPDHTLPPQTGDTANPLLYAALIGVSGLALVLLGTATGRRRDR